MLAPYQPNWVSHEPRLKVCMLAACPFPANHGTPGSIREMSEAIAARGHEVHVVTYHIGQDLPVRGLHLHRITPLTRETGVVVGPTMRRPLYDLQMVFKTLQVIKQHHVDLLHAHAYEAGLIAWLCRLMTGLPVVYSGHNTMTDELASYRFIRPACLARGLGKLLDAMVPRLAQRCLPHSANIARFFRDMGLAARTEPVVNFGIDLDWARHGDGAMVRRRHDLTTEPVVLYTGVLDQFQRIDLLLESFALVRELRARLLLVTTIPCAKHEAAIRAHAERLGIADRVILTEPQPLGELRHYLAACDVAVVPRPRASGFPIKLLNYLAAEKPCVLFASSASTGLAHGDNCYLAQPDTAAALADALSTVIADAALQQRLGRNGYEFVRAKHDRNVIAQEICATYLRTLAAAHYHEAALAHAALA